MLCAKLSKKSQNTRQGERRKHEERTCFPGESCEQPDWSTPYGRTKGEATEEKGYFLMAAEHIRATKQHLPCPLRLLLPRCDFQWSLLARRKMMNYLFLL
jgi:hypothetical protein